MTMWRLAWRNVWRNRRRSSLTIASIAFGLAAVMIGQSLMKTVQAQMVEKSTGVHTGHIQVQALKVRDRRVPDETLKRPVEIEAAMRADPRVKAVSMRLLYSGLAYSAAGSRGILVAGVEPETEKELSIIPGYMKEGTYFGNDPRALVLGIKIARVLDIRVGEKLVVMAQSKSGNMNSELFRVSGIFESGSEMYDSQIAYISLAAAQRIRGEEGRVSYLISRLRDFNQVDAVRAELDVRSRGTGAAVLTYKETGTEILGIQKFEDAVMDIVLLVIFLIVGLGVMNTISMSLLERLREFGVLRAIGARGSRIARMLVLESVMMCSVGVLFGVALGTSLIHYFGRVGLSIPVGEALSYFLPFDTVIYLRPFWGMHMRSLVGIAVVSVLAALGPAFRAARMGVSEALRHV
ncbi:MAG: ABC transporter permease [Elusimicrobia bacterium]|nr:ABC transporter permease [Elusimicrobiota bacterium]